jgi:hypothetical protein
MTFEARRAPGAARVRATVLSMLDGGFGKGEEKRNSDMLAYAARIR